MLKVGKAENKHLLVLANTLTSCHSLVSFVGLISKHIMYSTVQYSTVQSLNNFDFDWNTDK